MRLPIASLILASTVCIGDRARADGKGVFDEVCSKCHRTGVLNAPVVGNRGMWEPRLKAGKEKLYESVINGKNDMPPKGGKDRLSNEEVMSAVDYMIDLAGL
jgi:cytochrome c5